MYILKYILFGVIMQTAKIFANGGSQAVRLPKDYQFQGKELIAHKVGEAVLLVPYNKKWEVFLHGLNSFTEDFMSEGRKQIKNTKREKL
jgi:antitoxin VapB